MAYGVMGLIPLLWMSGEWPRGLRQQRLRVLAVLPGAVLAGLLGALLTNGWP